VTLSGSTIWAEREILPLKNIPVIHPLFEADLSPAEVVAGINGAMRRWDLNAAADQFAIAIDLKKSLDYAALLVLAEGMRAFANLLPSEKPLVIIIERDYAQALGQTIKGMAPERPLLVIDQVGLQEGDYIDIGSPLMDGRVVPLSVKTLVFYH
jgi:ethanolamine utilization protein EutA